MFEAVGPDALVRTRIADLNQEQIERFGDHLQRGIDDGTIRDDVDVEAEAHLVLAGLRGPWRSSGWSTPMARRPASQQCGGSATRRPTGSRPRSVDARIAELMGASTA